MQQNSVMRFTHFNFIDKLAEAENEDAVELIETRSQLRMALSDGAGAAGIFCKNWAEYLVKHQPEFPFLLEEVYKSWFLKISKDFYTITHENLDKNDPFILEKFITEGSYATLLYVWHDKIKNQLSYTGIGDTALFIFRSFENMYKPILITPIDEQETLNDFPKLLNWNRTLSYNMMSKTIDLNKGDVIILCTDSISRWLIYYLLLLEQNSTEKLLGATLSKSIDKDILQMLYMKGKYGNLNHLLKEIELNFKKGNEYFLKELKQLVNDNELEKDDYSILMKTI